MKRYALEQLAAWARKPNEVRKPMIVRGARQVGKTWLMQELGRSCFSKTAYVSLVDHPEATRAFDGPLDAQVVMDTLSAISGTEITAGNTLVVLDEIQESEKALNALKFLRENAPQYHVIAAGSLLGVAVRQRKMSFPVGQVEFLNLHPLGFCEFLEALGETQAVRHLQQRNTRMLDILSEQYERLLKYYLCVGGMPEAVAEFARSRDLLQVRYIQGNILTSYEGDFFKYTQAADILRIRAVWESLPRQLARENKKFTYKEVAESARGRDYAAAIEWLLACGLVHKVGRITKPALPLRAYMDPGVFKLYALDCGLMGAMAGLDTGTIVNGSAIFEEFKGALTEQYVLQTLLLQQDMPLAYWANSGGAAEVDFVLQHKGQVIPMEVKAATNLKAKSLNTYRDKFSQRCAVRTSLAHYGEKDGLLSLPLYALEQISAYLPEYHLF